jgi:hypothetical protein
MAKAPVDWEEYQVRDRIPMGGCGDDVAEVVSVEPSGRSDYDWGWDFCD